MPFAGEAKVGLRYKVRLSDCCVDATFTATLVRVVIDLDVPDDASRTQTFWSNGVTIERGGTVQQVLEA